MFKALRPCYHRGKIWVSQYPPVYAALSKIRNRFKFVYPDSPLAHRYLDGLCGIEIGASAFNPFGLNTLNINHTTNTEAVFKQSEASLSGHSVKIDVVALGDRLPFADNSVDFVLTSHVIEHFFDPITALEEWRRVTRPEGYIFVICPHKERTFDMARPRTTLEELIDRHASHRANVPSEAHHNVWITEDFLKLCHYLGFNVVDFQDMDDKVGNGFTVVINKEATSN